MNESLNVHTVSPRFGTRAVSWLNIFLTKRLIEAGGFTGQRLFLYPFCSLPSSVTVITVFDEIAL